MLWDAMLFDLDGTLWDSTEGVLTSWNRGLAAHGLSPFITRTDLESCMGLLLPDIAARLFPDMEADERLMLIKDCMRLENAYLAQHGGELYPGVPETLAQLSEAYPLAIVSNCGDGYIESFFAAHHLDQYITDYEHPGRTGLDKAGNIRAVVERNGWRHPVYVGDTRIDLDASRSAGIPFIHAAYGFGRLDGVRHLDRFSDLPALLRHADEAPRPLN